MEHTVEEERDDRDDRQSAGSDEDDILENSLKIFGGGLSGTNTRDETALLFEIVRYFQRIEGDRCVEIREEDHQNNVENQSDVVDRACQ